MAYIKTFGDSSNAISITDTVPVAPANGNIWRDGTLIKMYSGGETVVPTALAGIDGDLQINSSGALGTIGGLNLDKTGNARGSGSLDIQSSRSADTQVASGANATAVGVNNISSGGNSAAIGAYNDSSSTSGSAIGNYNTSSATYGQSSAIGAFNTASGPFGSTAIGNTNTASGSNATAVGDNNTASAVRNTSVGYDNDASGHADNTAVGSGNTVSASYFGAGGGSAVGYSNTASGGYSSAVGYSNTASGYKESSAVGYSNTASGTRSAAFGHSNTASGSSAVAFGKGNTAVDSATAIGSANAATGIGAVAFGSSNASSGDGSVAFGINQGALADGNMSAGTNSSFFNLNTVGFSVNNMNALVGTHITSDLLVTDITSLDSEKVTNGTFTGSASGWTLGTGWTYGSDRVAKSIDGTGTLSQDVGAVAGEYYLLIFSIVNFTAGTLDISLGGESVEQLNSYSGFGKTYKAVIQASTTGDLIFTPSNTMRMTLDDVSVKKITGGDLLLPLGLVQTKVYTVATLPAAGTAGRRAFVSDANATTFASIVAAGGANNIPVYDDGTNWRIG